MQHTFIFHWFWQMISSMIKTASRVNFFPAAFHIIEQSHEPRKMTKHCQRGRFESETPTENTESSKLLLNECRRTTGTTVNSPNTQQKHGFRGAVYETSWGESVCSFISHGEAPRGCQICSFFSFSSFRD